jgi:hypothetical protein
VDFGYALVKVSGVLRGGRDSNMEF